MKVGPTGFRSSGQGESEFETIVVGAVRGERFLDHDFTWASQLDKLLERLEVFRVSDGAYVTEDDALSEVCKLNRAQLAITVNAFRQVLREVARLYEKVRNHSEFMSLENLELLKRWCEHPDNDCQFTIRIQAESVIFREPYGGYASLAVGGARKITDLVGFEPI